MEESCSHGFYDCVVGVEEEKKTDDMSHDGGVVYTPPKEETPVESKMTDKAESSKPVESKTATVEPKPIGVLGQSFRFLLLDLPLLLLLSLYAGMHLADWAKEEYFSNQYEGLMWDGTRQAEEIT